MLINLLIGDKRHNIFYLFFQLMDSFLRIPKRYIMLTCFVYDIHTVLYLSNVIKCNYKKKGMGKWNLL